MAMAKNFIHDDFILTNKTAVELYHRYAADQPIIGLPQSPLAGGYFAEPQVWRPV